MKIVLPSRRWGPFRQEFYSICSAHQRNNATCSTCAIGSWNNVWQRRVGGFVYKRWPRLWRWWANFPTPKLKLEPRDPEKP